MYEKIKNEMEFWLKDYEKNLFPLQERFLISLLEQLKDTIIGKERGYASIKSIEDFQSQTHIQHYRDLKPYIDRIIDGEINVLHPEPPTDWIRTSGSTDLPKVYPYNKDYMRCFSIAKTTILNYFIYRVGSKALKLLEGEFLSIHASADCGTLGTGLTKKTIAMLSGWAAKQRYANDRSSSRLRISLIPDWQERIFQTAIYYVQKNVTHLTSNTSVLFSFMDELENAFDGKLFSALAEYNPELTAELQRFYQEDGKIKVSRVWPNLLGLFLMGVEPYKYKKLIDLNFPKSIIFQTYGGTENASGFQYDVTNPAMVLQMKSAFYEFLDLEEYINWQFHNRSIPTRHTVADVKAGNEYVLCVSNYLGLTTYIPGDIIKIVSTTPLLFLYSRRVGGEVNIAGEKMNANHIAEAIRKASAKNQCVYREYLCTGLTEPRPHYVVAVEFSTPPENLARFVMDLEKSLYQLNVIYAAARIDNALKPLRMINLPAGEFDRYIATQTKAGQWNAGQSKLPYLTDRQDFLDFIQANKPLASYLSTADPRDVQ